MHIHDNMQKSNMKEALDENQGNGRQGVLKQSQVIFSSARWEFTNDFSRDDYIAELEFHLKTRTGAPRSNPLVRE